MLYWINFIVVALFLCFLSLEESLNSRIRKVFQILLILTVIYFSAFRDGLGQDYDGYFDLLKYGELTEYSIKEPGFSLFSNIVFFTYLSPIFFFLVMSTVTNYLFLKSFYRYRNTFIIVFIYLTGSIFYFNTFNLVRQMFAVSIFMYSVRFIEDRKFFYYLICILIATTLHTSALFLLPVYFFIHKVFSKNWLLFIVFLSFLIGQVIKLNLTNFLGQFLSVYYWYFEGDEVVVDSGYLTLFFNVILICLIFYRKKNNEIKYNISFNLFFIGVILYNLIPSFYFLFRFATYFIMFAPIVLPTLDKIVPKKIWAFILIVGFGTMFILFLVDGQENSKIVPNKMLNLESVFD